MKDSKSVATTVLGFTMASSLTVSDGTSSNQASRIELREFDCSLQRKNCELVAYGSSLMDQTGYL